MTRRDPSKGDKTSHPRPDPNLGPEPGTVDPDVFVNAWVGVPFKWDGRDRAGVDCWGLVWRFYFDVLGVRLPDWSVGDNGQTFANALFVAQVEAHFNPFAKPRDFALALMPQGRRPAHVGVCWRGGVIHSQSGVGVAWEPLARFLMVWPNAQFGEFVE